MNRRGAGAPSLPRIPALTLSVDRKRAEFDHKAERFVTWLNTQYEKQMKQDVREWMDDLRKELYEHYRVWVNPLYRPMIDSIVEIDGMCRQLFAEAKVIDEQTSIVHDRYHRWRLLQLHFIRQLQRHTEALTFSVRQYKDEADTLLQLVWKVLTEQLPQEMQEDVFDALLDAVQSGMRGIAPLEALGSDRSEESEDHETLKRGRNMGPQTLAPWESIDLEPVPLGVLDHSDSSGRSES